MIQNSFQLHILINNQANTTEMDELKKLTTPKNYDKFDKKIVGKQFLLGKFYDSNLQSLISPACKNKHHNIKKFPSNFSAKIESKIRKLLQTQLKIKEKLTEKNKQNEIEKQVMGEQKQMLSYEIYIPLHRLWMQYIEDLISKEKNKESKQLKILKSDFHGAQIVVVESKNETLIGISGIVIKQTLRTFQIVVKVHEPINQTSGEQKGQKNIKILLKPICVFLLKVGQNTSFIINGSSLVYRPSDRIRHKFKFKNADIINYSFLSLLNDVKQQQANQRSQMEEQQK